MTMLKCLFVESLKFVVQAIQKNVNVFLCLILVHMVEIRFLERPLKRGVPIKDLSSLSFSLGDHLN
jgi:hypothetical protein